MTYADNRKASYEYEILEKFEGGLVLTGNEVKSIREGGAKLAGAYLQVFRAELWLIGMHVSPYSKGRADAFDPTARRKVLVTKKELHTLAEKTHQKGLTLVPFSLYPSARRIKLSFALCRGKKLHDKRDAIKERELKRRIREDQD